jgi:hypothetical protein
MRPISRIAFLLLLVAAALPATAHAGGWATVEVDSQPVGLSAGDPWRVELLVKQHGRTPLDGVQPSVRIDNGAGVVRTFRARPTGRPGTYVAVVTYPSAGTWQTRLFDGFTEATPHRLAPVRMPAAGDGKSVMGTGKTVKGTPDEAGGAALPRDYEAVGTAPASSDAGTAPASDTAPASAPDDGGTSWPVIVALGLVALAFVVAIVAAGGPLTRRRRSGTAPQQYLPTQ